MTRVSWPQLAMVGCVSLLVGASLLISGGLPLPRVHDEFSYTLAADTFASGRLTNPPHPMWVHFESFHIIQQPTYASKYPVGQGLSMAIGQVMTGYPIVGVWLTIALACMATTWALAAWVPSRWAVAGGLLAAIHPQMMRWDHEYWGGGVAMLGGALVVGAARRLVDAPRPSAAMVMAVGLAILANSRPFEGLVLGLVVAIPLVVSLAVDGPGWRSLLRQVVAPAAAVLMATAGMMAFYNWRVTASPVEMPYTLHEATYATIPPFGWQGRREAPIYRHDVMRRYWTEGWNAPQEERPPKAASPPRSRAYIWLRRYFVGAGTLLEAFALNPALILALAGLPTLLVRDRRLRWATGALALGLGGILLGAWMQVHYAAPFVGLGWLVAICSMHEVTAGGRRRWLVVLITALSLTACAIEYRSYARQRAARADDWFNDRARMESALTASGEPALVVVRYSPQHPVLDEWVFNAADIDGSPVVWAREMDPAQNARLFDYFANRRVWLVEADRQPLRLVPYRAVVSDTSSENR